MIIPRYTNSQLEHASICPAMSYFERILYIKPIKRSIHSEYGKAIHLAFEVYFSLRQDNIARNEARDKAMEAFVDYFTSLDLVYHGQKNVQTAEMVIRGYAEQDSIQPEEILGVEILAEKEIKIDGDTYIYGGKIDLLIGPSQGLVTVNDHKTIGQGRFNSYTYNKWTLSRQLIGYAWLNNTNLLKVTVVYCLMEPEIHILSFVYSPAKLNRWVTNTIGLIKTLDDRIKQYYYWDKHKGNNVSGLITPEELFPRIGSKCMTQYGGCAFENLCRQDCDIQDIIINDVDFTEMTEEEKLL